MSTKIFFTYGNDTIDRYPPAYEGKLTKILCIRKELFEKLKAALAEFGFKLKLVPFKPKPYSGAKTSKKEPLGDSRNDNRKPDRDKCTGSFEPSNIFNTRYSDFWRFRNLNAWFKEQGSYEDSRYLNAYQIKI